MMGMAKILKLALPWRLNRFHPRDTVRLPQPAAGKLPEYLMIANNHAIDGKRAMPRLNLNLTVGHGIRHQPFRVAVTRGHRSGLCVG
jgi:hypothetical protein